MNISLSNVRNLGRRNVQFPIASICYNNTSCSILFVDRISYGTYLTVNCFQYYFFIVFLSRPKGLLLSAKTLRSSTALVQRCKWFSVEDHRATGPRKKFDATFSRLDTIHQRDGQTDVKYTGRKNRAIVTIVIERQYKVIGSLSNGDILNDLH